MEYCYKMNSMYKSKFLFILLLIVISLNASGHGVSRELSFDEKIDSFHSKDYTGFSPVKTSAIVEGVIAIPVVVHVVYNTAEENISDAQIQSQIQVLNEDFRRLNSDQDNLWPQAADSEIEFCLAQRDGNGDSTNGITRTFTDSTEFVLSTSMKSETTGGISAWPSDNYLNIWVCDISSISDEIHGFATIPGSTPSLDGVVIDTRNFGTIVGILRLDFALGRTTTHAVGHWLDLIHIWGDGDCTEDDLVDDTPLSDDPNYNCDIGHISCGSVDMVQNYMDLSDDACRNLFTEGQKTRMRLLFDPGGLRESILTSEGCSPPVIIGQKYRFLGTEDNLYTNPNNWDTSGGYSGYPGTNVPLGDTIKNSSSIMEIPIGAILNLSCLVSFPTGLISNSGTIYFNHGSDNSLIVHMNNSSSGQIFIDATISLFWPSNNGVISVEKDGWLNISEFIVNDHEIQVKEDGTISGGSIDNTNGKIINYGSISNRISNGIIENHGYIFVITNGIILGSGDFAALLNPVNISPGGQGNVGSITVADLILDVNSTLEMEVDHNAASSVHDQIIIGRIISLNGNLKVERIDGFQSMGCLAYPLIQIKNPSGKFSSITASNFGAYNWYTSQSSDDFTFHLTPGDASNRALDFNADSNLVFIDHDLDLIKTIEFKFFPKVIDPNVVGDNILNYFTEPFKFIWTMNTTGSLTGETLTVLNNSRLYTEFPFEQKWYHVAIVSNSGNTYDKIYVDGVDINAVKQTTGQFNSATLFDLNTFTIGGRDTIHPYVSGFFDGRMDEFRFWSDTRTEAEIQGNWYKELDPGDTQGLMAYYKFNRGIANQDNNCNTVLVDHSGNNHHGQLYDFILNGETSNWVGATSCPPYITVETNAYNENAIEPLMWSDVDNWSLGEIPTGCHNVVIPEGIEVIVDVFLAVCYNLQLE